MDQAGYGMPGRKYYFVERNNSMLMAYENLAKSIAIGLGANEQTATDDMKKVVDLEINIAQVKQFNFQNKGKKWNNKYNTFYNTCCYIYYLTCGIGPGGIRLLVLLQLEIEKLFQWSFNEKNM